MLWRVQGALLPPPLLYVTAFLFCLRARADELPKLLLVSDVGQRERTALDALQRGLAGAWRTEALFVDRESEQSAGPALADVCSALRSAALVLDLTWSGWDSLRRLARGAGTPYVLGDMSVRPFLQAADEVLQHRNVTDAALVFSDEQELTQGIFYLVGRSPLRVLVAAGLDDGAQGGTSARIAAMRPTPGMHVLLSAGGDLERMARRAARAGLVGEFSRWMLVDTDPSASEKGASGAKHLANSTIPVSVLRARASACCAVMGQSGGQCACPQRLHELLPPVFADVLRVLAAEARRTGIVFDRPGTPMTEDGGQTTCKVADQAANVSAPLVDLLQKVVSERPGLRLLRLDMQSEASLLPDLVLDVAMVTPGEDEGAMDEDAVVGEWSPVSGYTPRKDMPTLRRFLRIGIVESLPWAYREGNTWKGYCVDFAHKLADLMDFDMELVPSSSYGERNLLTGSWDGALGDLVAGRTDILAADLTMTAQREEAIDFVPPYFEQSGISIVIRKPVRKTSLFKFMTVLRLEVWLSIMGALVVTAVMVWLLDKYSPYSAQNTEYPYPCRRFTLKESFWFALTSFTPQGGGEAPKALSGRTLVAAYWLFVVLMLATFTANLAAFLTVERMQTPVQSLDQLARQSRINYSVVENSDTHSYFRNMKFAEDTLYRMWKEITLNASSDETQYRVWDYPIREQYGHILLAIEKSGLLPNAETGLQKVIESEEAEFAFIHNAAQLRYEVSRNCNLTEVGEVFAEQPYALAVQQGSYLQEEISRKILELQKDRYFESLTAKYWNYSLTAECSNSGDNEGITLESLGGVFIATLCGLAFALITLGFEVLYYKRKSARSVVDIDPAAKGPGAVAELVLPGIGNPVKGNRNILLTKSTYAELARRKLALAPGSKAKATEKQEPNVTYISVYPRDIMY